MYDTEIVLEDLFWISFLDDNVTSSYSRGFRLHNTSIGHIILPYLFLLKQEKGGLLLSRTLCFSFAEQKVI